MEELLGPSLQHLSAAQAAHLTWREYFPALISQSFRDGLHEAFDFAIVCSLGRRRGLLVPGRPLRARHGGGRDPCGRGRRRRAGAGRRRRL